MALLYGAQRDMAAYLLCACAERNQRRGLDCLCSFINDYHVKGLGRLLELAGAGEGKRRADYVGSLYHF